MEPSNQETRSGSTSELLAALFKIQSLGLKAKRDTEGYGYKYADMDQIWDLLREPLKEHQLLVAQAPVGKQLVTNVYHVPTGQNITSQMDLMIPDESTNHMQDLGGAITYARRYALTSLFNIVTNDDDNASNTTTNRVASANRLATDKQLDYARSLLRKAKFNEDAIDERMAKVTSSKDANELIEKLKANV